MGREADVDRQDPELLEQLQDADFGGRGQGDDHEVDGGETGEVDEVGGIAELGKALLTLRTAVVVAIVEDAENGQLVTAGFLQRGNQRFGHGAAAEDDGPLLQATGAGEAARRQRRHRRRKAERHHAGHVPDQEPQAGNVGQSVADDQQHRDEAEDARPGDQELGEALGVAAQQRQVVGAENLGDEQRQDGGADRNRERQAGKRYRKQRQQADADDGQAGCFEGGGDAAHQRGGD